MKIFGSKLIWLEITKMIDTNFLCFSNKFLCRGNKDFSILSEYSFDIYMEGFLIFANTLCTKYNNQVFLFSSLSKNSFINSFPTKFHLNNNFSNLKKVFLSCYKNFYSFYIIHISKNIMLFKRNFHLYMYKYHSIIFFSGSKKFSLFIKQKVFSFVKSNLHFDIFECAARFLFI